MNLDWPLGGLLPAEELSLTQTDEIDTQLADAGAPSAPGRSCPLHYRYRPSEFAVEAAADWRDIEVLYVVGGLYGDELALHEALRLFDAEVGDKRLLFNGDFHWFDADPALFARVQREVLAHHALRGNVETELAAEPDPETDPGAATGVRSNGCGCAYPEWVGEGVVERSNRMLERLRSATTQALRAELAALPMWLRADVGGARIGIVHGDAESLAGWGFAQEHLLAAAQRERVRGWFDAAQVDVFASTHTCLPVFQSFHAEGPAAPRWVCNNGAAGMPNFRGDGAGLLTRIATRPFTGQGRRFGTRRGELHLDAIAIDTDATAVQRCFLAQWPAGSDAHLSYFDRIAHGPDYRVTQALRTEP